MYTEWTCRCCHKTKSIEQFSNWRRLLRQKCFKLLPLCKPCYNVNQSRWLENTERTEHQKRDARVEASTKLYWFRVRDSLQGDGQLIRSLTWREFEGFWNYVWSDQVKQQMFKRIRISEGLAGNYSAPIRWHDIPYEIRRKLFEEEAGSCKL